MSVAEILHLSKSFGKTNALSDINASIEEGEIFGFIGPDGAGKSTLIRTLATLIVPDQGTVSVFNLDVVKDYKEIRPLLGYMPGRFSLYLDLTVKENMVFFASVFGTTLEENYDLVRPIYHLLEPFEDRQAGRLSGGMKQKLALSCALIHRPALLLLDEPTTGVDAVSRKEFWEMLGMLKNEGISIIVSTPYMDEAKRCDRVALMQEGKILQIDSPDKIVSSFDKPLLGIKSDYRYKLLVVLKQYPYTHSVHPFGEYAHYTDSRQRYDFGELHSYLERNGLKEIIIKEIKPDIEDSFMAMLAPGGSND
ncbi:MAG: ABC transporter ATP-binding protein [Balneolales bacterium]